jgi:hypothetical protein
MKMLRETLAGRFTAAGVLFAAIGAARAEEVAAKSRPIERLERVRRAGSRQKRPAPVSLA